MSKCDKPYVHNEKDTYLTLDVLTAILETLSGSGKLILPKMWRTNIKKATHFVGYLLPTPRGHVLKLFLKSFI